MSKRIKFRAWDKDKIEYADGVGDLYMNISEIGTNTFEIAQMCPGRYVIEQYTGLKDKNDKRIYEGDIVKIKWNYYKIVFDEENARFALKHIPKKDEVDFDMTSPIMPYLENNSGEILGNIHENPELLEDD